MLRNNYCVCRYTSINLILSLPVNITYMTTFTLNHIFPYAYDFLMYFDVKHNEIHIENVVSLSKLYLCAQQFERYII